MPVLTIRQGSRRQAIPFSPGACLGDLLHGAAHAHPCGGRGVCGKCLVLLKGRTAPVLSCQTRLGDQDEEVFLPEAMPFITLTEEVIVPAATGPIGAAVDIGTTTLALALYDLSTGACLAQAGMLNPQVSVAADVIGRIDAAMKGQLHTQQQMLRAALDALLAQACAQAGVDPQQVARRVITGNTTMLYLLQGRDPTCLSRAPFQADTLFGTDTAAGYLSPCMNAFVGADVTCSVLACGLCETDETALLCDLGTNGELALWHNGTLYVTSTAAGPVFEGACISCGVGSVPGAIHRVWPEDGTLRWAALGDLPPVGLCGSGLLDAVAALLDTDQLDETGRLAGPCSIAPSVSLTQADIRAVQLAKAAIAAGITTLLHHAACTPEDVQHVHIAGGFGSHANMASAARIGLLPESLANRAKVHGNAALRGAAMLLTRPDPREPACRIAASAVHVPLGGNPFFNEAYMDAMLFE